VGYATTNIGTQRAFFSASGTGVMRNLGSLGGGGASSRASAIVGKLVVGSSAIPAPHTPPFHAALWIVP
jgi:uncharacterized membrane protein